MSERKRVRPIGAADHRRHVVRVKVSIDRMILGLKTEAQDPRVRAWAAMFKTDEERPASKA